MSAIRALEFYSGLGGLHYALEQSFPGSQVVRAYDINDTANDVYEHNFGSRPCQTNIDSLTAAQLDKLGANVWLLSPPCQPYTRRGLRRHSADDRAASFISLLRHVRNMKTPPVALLLENVVGFEASDTRAILLDTLRDLDFEVCEVIACPSDLGVPYSRPRYFATARRRGAGAGALAPPPQAPFRPVQPDGSIADRPCAPRPAEALASFLVADPGAELAGGVRAKLENDIRFKQRGVTDAEGTGLEGQSPSDTTGPSPSSSAPLATAASFQLGQELLLKNGWCLDIVTPKSTRTCCFTKTYGQYIKGSGSVLAPAGREEAVKQVMEAFPCLVPRRDADAEAASQRLTPASEDLAAALAPLALRFFTPQEIAALHGFPGTFAFPASVTLRQRYSLLGNSLHVHVVALLLEHLLTGVRLPGDGGA